MKSLEFPPIGTKFGYLTVTEAYIKTIGNKHIKRVKLACVCGKSTDRPLSILTNQGTRSCGCINQQKSRVLQECLFRRGRVFKGAY